MTPPTTAARRAIGIVRVSQVKGRKGDRFASPAQQCERIRDACESAGLGLIETIEELDVSGGTPLVKRDGLRRAVEAVEAGEADVIVAAYFDRLVRSLEVQGELVRRVEAAGGQVLAVDVGAVKTNGSVGEWISGTILGFMSEYQRRSAAERSGAAQARAVARGVLPFPNPPGYLRGDKDGVLVVDPQVAPVVVEAFRLRADGSTIAEVREHLRKNGIQRSYHGVSCLLGSRVVLGEIHFGKLVNLDAHPAIVKREVWQAVQRAKSPRGRKAKSDRLLARLGVLRCGTCGARMVVGTANHGQYRLYRCPPTGDCKRRVTISAEIVEGIVVDAVRSRLSDVQGRASAESSVQEAQHRLETAQADLDAAIRTFVGLQGESAARDRLAELREVRDHAQEQVDQLGGARATVTISASADWERLTLSEQRDLIRATVNRVEVSPGRGPDRTTVTLVGAEPAR